MATYFKEIIQVGMAAHKIINTKVIVNHLRLIKKYTFCIKMLIKALLRCFTPVKAHSKNSCMLQ